MKRLASLWLSPLALCVLTGALLLLSTPAARAADPYELEKAKQKLKERMEARRKAGWKPKSKQEQLITGLRVKSRYYERSRMAAQQKAEFQQAKADAYMSLAKHYMTIGTTYYRYTTSLVEDYTTGTVRPVTTRSSYVVVDPLAAAIAARWGDQAAQFNGYAAAQRYRASTWFASKIDNVERRIQAIQYNLDGER